MAGDGDELARLRRRADEAGRRLAAVYTPDDPDDPYEAMRSLLTPEGRDLVRAEADVVLAERRVMGRG